MRYGIRMQDHVSDHNNIDLLFAKQKLGDLPSYVEHASASREQLSKMASEGFADKQARQFPIHSKADAYRSYLRLKYRGDASKKLEIVKRACVSFGIGADIEKIDSLFGTTKEAGEKQAEYALPEHSMWPINSVSQVIESARALNRDSERMPVGDLRLAAGRIKSAAARLGMRDKELPGITAEIGDERLFCGETLVKELKKRASMCPRDSADRKAYLELAKQAADLDFEDSPEEVVDLIRTMDAPMDHIKRAYGESIASPVRAVFGGMTTEQVKEAAAKSYDIDDRMVPIHALAAIPAPAITSFFKAASAATITKAAASTEHDVTVQQELASLSNHEKKQLLQLASVHGR